MSASVQTPPRQALSHGLLGSHDEAESFLRAYLPPS